MAQIPSHMQWLDDTAVFGRTRSDFLKRVDQAIQAYNIHPSPAAKEAIKTALDRWRFEQSKQGKDWKTNARNDKGAITNLYRALEGDRRDLTDEDLRAFAAQRQLMREALAKQFVGVKLEFKPNTVVGFAHTAKKALTDLKTKGTKLPKAETAKRFAQGAPALVSAGKSLEGVGKSASDLATAVRNLTKTACNDVEPNKVLSALGLENLDKFVANVTPVLGVISSGGAAIVAWIGVIASTWKAIEIEDRRYAIATGDPLQAFDALRKLLDREIASKTGQASVKTVAFAGKAAGTLADFGSVTGPAVGIMESLAEILQTIIEYVRDYKECERANRLIQEGQLSNRIFEACPLLGCYYLVIQDHSTIIHFAVEDYGTPNWMGDVEGLRKKIEVVLEKSQEYIRGSRLYIASFQNYKGIVEKNYSVKTGLDRVTSYPEHVKDLIAQKVSDKVSGPKPKVVVDPSRIRGIGSQSATSGR